MKIYIKRSKAEYGNRIAYIKKFPPKFDAWHGDSGERYLAKITRVRRNPRKWCISVIYVHLIPCLDEQIWLRDARPWFNNLKEVKEHLEQEYFLQHL